MRYYGVPMNGRSLTHFGMRFTGVVESVKASQPETQSVLETHGTTDCGVVPIGPHLPSLSSGTRTRLT